MKIKLRKFNAEDAYLLKKYQFHQMDMNEIKDMIALWNKNLYNGRYCEVFAAEYDGALSGWFSMAKLPNGRISIGPTVFEPYRQKEIAFSVMQNLLFTAKRNGYSLAEAQIRINNAASIKLHEKLGYIQGGKVINRNLNEVFVYTKELK